MTPYLGDTNVLLRLALRRAPEHRLVRTAIRNLRQRGDQLYYTPQNLVEFWNVCTRPVTARGGFGLTLAQTDWASRIIERAFTLLPDTPAVHAEWRRLVMRQGVTGVQVHDARLVSVMRVHEIRHLVTFNCRDLQRYPDVVAVHPRDL